VSMGHLSLRNAPDCTPGSGKTDSLLGLAFCTLESETVAKTFRAAAIQ